MAKSTNTSETPQTQSVTSVGKILKCFSGSLLAGSLGVLLFRLTVSISAIYAHKPIASTNITAINIASAVRTLVIGMVALGSGVFSMAALGLFLLGIQLTVQRLLGQHPASDT